MSFDPGADQDRPVAGLRSPVEIIVDEWGVPHIYAADDHDLYFAQGHNAARDRLFQIDIGRRRGLGLLAEVFGADYVEQDRAARLLQYRGDLDAEWASYGDDAREIVTAFVEGINAYVDWVGEDRDRLPPEFLRWGIVPSHWQPEDVVRCRTHGLFNNVEQEAARAAMLRDAGERAERFRHKREPDDPYLVPEGLDLGAIDDAVLEIYRLAFRPVTFPAGEVVDRPSLSEGSNNWVIGAGRSSTGRPVVANDPHRVMTLPSLRYIAHLESPTTRVIGGGEPSLPGISIGHNGEVAFGLTIGFADQEDLYLYELDPADPARYRYGSGWERMRVVEESIPVAGEDSRRVSLAFTRHGPVIFTSPDSTHAVAVRAAWLEPGTAPYLASLRYAHSRTAGEFRESLRHWGAPSVNFVFADGTGAIGWQPAARIPRRPNWDGSLPVPGDGRYEWDGFAELEALPAFSGDDGDWFTTSNQMNLPPDWDNKALTITYDWPSSGRHRRLRGWLESDAEIGISESIAMQMDQRSLEAAEVMGLMRPIERTGMVEAELFGRLQAWDGDEAADSFEAVVFEVWLRRHLRPWLIDACFLGRGLGEAGMARVRALGHRDEAMGSDLRPDVWLLQELLADPMRHDALRAGIDRTLVDAAAELTALLGVDRAVWRWGALHRLLLRNQALAGEDAASGAVVGPVPRGGSSESVGVTAYGPDFLQTVGSSFRVVIDVGAWDESRAANTPGQSGDPRSPHYSDLFAAWADGGTFPLCFSRTEVERHAVQTIRLRPARSNEQEEGRRRADHHA